MKLRWTLEAQQELRHAQDFGRHRWPGKVVELTKAILNATERLRHFPALGRVAKVPGARELVVQRFPFVLVYMQHEGDLIVLRLFHQARNWAEEPNI